MNSKRASPLDELLARLCSGDAEAATQVFVEYEPYLRKVVRRLLPLRLRRKFDSMDIVQSAWGDLLSGFRSSGWRFDNPSQLRAFLIKVTRNRFLDRVRQHDSALAHECGVARATLDQVAAFREETPSQQVQAADLWQRILHLCPDAYRPIVLLKRQGLSAHDIAATTGLHAGSIRRILRHLASRVASDVVARRG